LKFPAGDFPAGFDFWFLTYLPMDTQQALLPKDSGNFAFIGRIFDWVVGDMPFASILVSMAISARLRGIVEPFFTTCGNSSIWHWS